MKTGLKVLNYLIFIIDISIAFRGTDTELVTRILKIAALTHPKVKNKAVDEMMNKISDNKIEMELLFWKDQSWDINYYKLDTRILYQEKLR